MGVNSDQVKGRMKEAEGKVQGVAGKVVGNNTQEVKGKIKEGVGAAQSKFGDMKENAKDSSKRG
jgi:uncharacterized protein YjbJ (UPF0337 family)